MRRTAMTAALALLLVGAGSGRGQPGGEEGAVPKKAPAKKAPAKSALETDLAEALKNNPDLRVAAAKAAEAEAVLYKARLTVVQKVVTQHRAIEAAKVTLGVAEERYALTREGVKAATVSRADLLKAQEAVQQAKAKVAAEEAELAYLLGKSPAGDKTAADAAAMLKIMRLYEQAVDSSMAAEALAQLATARVKAEPKGPMVDKLRKALDKRVTLEFKDASTAEVIARLRKEVPEVTIQVIDLAKAPGRLSGTLELVTFGAAVQWLEDSLEDYRVVVREYGLLIAPVKKVPPGAVTLTEFWKGGAGEKEKPKPTKAPEKDGKVKAVDDKTGLLRLSLGSDDGVAKGATLHVFRLGDKPRYLGTVLVVQVTPTESVGQPMKKLAEAPRAGDLVAASIIGK